MLSGMHYFNVNNRSWNILLERGKGKKSDNKRQSFKLEGRKEGERDKEDGTIIFRVLKVLNHSSSRTFIFVFVYFFLMLILMQWEIQEIALFSNGICK